MSFTHAYGFGILTSLTRKRNINLGALQTAHLQLMQPKTYQVPAKSSLSLNADYLVK
jgi:hypothetical protein